MFLAEEASVLNFGHSNFSFQQYFMTMLNRNKSFLVSDNEHNDTLRIT